MWILASRGRPHNLVRFINCWTDTNGSTPIYLRLDQCDPEIENYKKLNFPKEFNVVIGPRIKLAASSNEMFKEFPYEPWYGLLSDDLIPITTAWDIRLAEAASTNLIAQCEDLTIHSMRCQHPCIGGDLIRKVGWFLLPVCTHYYSELPWRELTVTHPEVYRYLTDVVVEHAHHVYGTAEKDSTYQDASDIGKQDKQIWKEGKRDNLEDFYKLVTA